MLAQSPFEAPFIARRLREGGAEVALVETAVDALAKIATTRFGLVVVDCAFGEEVVRSVAEEARRAGIARKLILLSPFDRREFGSPAAAGFDGYLLKPVRAHSLFQQLAPVPGATASPQAAGPARRAAARRPASRVLLAEDNEINALLALKSLEKLGAIADWAKTGEEALALAESALSGERPAYGLVLMDIRMPGLDGFETTRRIRQLEQALGVATAPADRRAHRQSAQRRRDLGGGRLRRLPGKTLRARGPRGAAEGCRHASRPRLLRDRVRRRFVVIKRSAHYVQVACEADASAPRWFAAGARDR